MEINHDVFSELKKRMREPVPWKGKNPRTWCLQVTHDACTSAGNKPMSRKELFHFCAQSNVDAKDMFVAICAWGRMRISNGRRAWHSVEKWSPVVAKLKGDCQNRLEAYRRFYKLCNDGNFPGVGPAFFTKLIFFIRPDLNGYIMDQWTARSINLLYGTKIKLTRLKPGEKMVSPTNPPEIYEEFCCEMEDLAQRLHRSPAEAEEVIFSNGGKDRASWRRYVIGNG